ncbi:hypothetical protein [Nocardioides sp.]|uniref:hypothetical protein n=1 Tax=Nocardioides sp. TaxID=35761 RepID=UPI00260B99B5|nr:hypothetical protein [Nocardioides sp.]
MTYTEDEVRRLPLTYARHELLEELLAQPYDVFARPRRRTAYRVALGSVAAAAIAAAGVTIVVQGRDQGSVPQVKAPSAGPTSTKGDSASPSASAGTGTFSVALVAKAERMPRLMLQRSGWAVDSVEGFGHDTGQLVFSDGAGYFSVHWFPRGDYDQRLAEWRSDPGPSAPADDEFTSTVLGERATSFRLGGKVTVTLLKPAGDSFVELRGMDLDETAYTGLLQDLRQLTVPEFLAAMPASVVKPSAAAQEAAAMLQGIPVPDGFRFKAPKEMGDRYQFGAAVTGQVLCAWVDVFKTGAAGRKAAADALATSPSWPILQEMAAKGDWPALYWQYADVVASGTLVGDGVDQGSFGCPGGVDG